jgi:hypothetical protein
MLKGSKVMPTKCVHAEMYALKLNAVPNIETTFTKVDQFR